MSVNLSQAHRIIDALPQRKFMKEQDIQKWLENIMANEPERVVWHANRLRGFGGSEIGVLVADMRNRKASSLDTSYHTFKSAREIIQEKLCITPPTRDEDDNSDDIKRGIIGEPWLIERLLEQLNQETEETVTVDHDTMNAMKGTVVNSEHPWLVGNIDLSLICGNTRLLTDIKWPRAGSAAINSRVIPFTYACQFEQYRLVAKSLPVPVDFNNAILASFDSDEFRFHLGAVPHDAELSADILKAGDYFWNNFVLKGKLPDFVPSKTPSMSVDEFDPSIKQGLDQLHSLKVLQRELGNQIESLEHEMSERMLKEKIVEPKGKIAGALGTLTIKSKCQYDNQKMIGIARRNKLEFDIESPEWQKNLHGQFLELDSVSANEIMEATKPKFNFTFPLSRAKKGVVAETIHDLKDVASDLTTKFVDTAVAFINRENRQDELSEARDKSVSYAESKLEKSPNGLKRKIPATQKADTNSAEISSKSASPTATNAQETEEYDDSYESTLSIL